MSRRTNVINVILTMGLTVAAVFAVVLVCNGHYSSATLGKVIALLAAGAVFSGLVITFLHELGHLICGRKNRFAFVSITVWFFKWQKIGNKTVFNFVMLGDSAGSTEMVAKDTDNLAVRLKKMTAAPLWITFFAMLIGIIPLFLTAYLPLWAFALISMFLPIGAYSFFGNALPASSEGVRNDGAVLYGLKKDDDESKVTLALLTIQSELYNGKTPSEIDESIYFDLPQLREDCLTFILLLNAKYAYYLDKEDFENTKKTTERLLSLTDYMSKPVSYVIKTDALYNACTFDFNTTTADELTYELEKFLNNVNTSENIRVKLAYILYVKKEKTGLEDFYNRGIREANRCPIKGLALYEKKLLLKMKEDIISKIN